jgi:hypothetical protein
MLPKKRKNLSEFAFILIEKLTKTAKVLNDKKQIDTFKQTQISLNLQDKIPILRRMQKTTRF